jgi:hypothetical protein
MSSSSNPKNGLRVISKLKYDSFGFTLARDGPVALWDVKAASSGPLLWLSESYLEKGVIIPTGPCKGKYRTFNNLFVSQVDRRPWEYNRRTIAM